MLNILHVECGRALLTRKDLLPRAALLVVRAHVDTHQWPWEPHICSQHLLTPWAKDRHRAQTPPPILLPSSIFLSLSVLFSLHPRCFTWSLLCQTDDWQLLSPECCPSYLSLKSSSPFQCATDCGDMALTSILRFLVPHLSGGRFHAARQSHTEFLLRVCNQNQTSKSRR